MADSRRNQSAGEETVARRKAEIRAPDWKVPCLIVIQGAQIGRDYRLRPRPQVLGRDAGVEILIADDAVSRRHARIDFEDAGGTCRYWLTDLESTNSTFVNGRAVGRVELNDGDKVQVGETILKFSLLDDIEVRFHREVRDRLLYDPATGLLTKESLLSALEYELRRAAHYRLPLSVFMMDLDHFKNINDTHGHLVGSEVLKEVATIIRRNLRGGDITGRYGGEEFIAYLVDTPADKAAIAAERIRKAIGRSPLVVGESRVEVTVSIGVASYPLHGQDVESLLRQADAALYRCKSMGRNRVQVAE